MCGDKLEFEIIALFFICRCIHISEFQCTFGNQFCIPYYYIIVRYIKERNILSFGIAITRSIVCSAMLPILGETV